MNFYRLSQTKYREPAIYVNTIIVIAPDSHTARILAQDNENKHREGELNWLDKNSAKCRIICAKDKAKVILCA